jgi:hypothetical protein
MHRMVAALSRELYRQLLLRSACGTLYIKPWFSVCAWRRKAMPDEAPQPFATPDVIAESRNLRMSSGLWLALAQAALQTLHHTQNRLSAHASGAARRRSSGAHQRVARVPGQGVAGVEQMADAAATAQQEQQEINTQVFLSWMRLTWEEAHARCKDAEDACWYAHLLRTENRRLRTERLH